MADGADDPRDDLMTAQLINNREGSTTTTEAELDWDNNSLTVNLSNPLERIRMFSLSSYATESDNDSVFDPVLFVPPSPDSPPSPYVRVTRNLLREGEFVRASQMGPFVSARVRLINRSGISILASESAKTTSQGQDRARIITNSRQRQISCKSERWR